MIWRQSHSKFHMSFFFAYIRNYQILELDLLDLDSALQGQDHNIAEISLTLIFKGAGGGMHSLSAMFLVLHMN